MARQKRARAAAGFRIQERDLEIVEWLGRVRLATVVEVQQRFEMARSKAYGRLQGLVELGLVEHERRVPGLGVFLATRRGLAAAECELAPARLSLGSVQHDLALAAVVAELEVGEVGDEVLTERELRALGAEDGVERFRPRLQRRRGGTSRHWPDLVVLDRSMWLAVEVELTQKSAERTREILAGYRAEHYARPSSGLWAVLYLTPEARRAEHLKNLGRREQLGLETTPLLQAQPLDAPAGLAVTYRHMVTVHNAIQNRQREAQAEARRREQERIAVERAKQAARKETDRRRRAEEQDVADAAAERTRRRFRGFFAGDTRSG